MNPRLPIWLSISGLSALIGLSVFWLPAPLPKEAAPKQFSAGRAREIDLAIAQKPHPATSAEDLRVVGVLSNTLSALGYRPRLIEGDVAGRHLTDTVVGPSYNVLNLNAALRYGGIELGLDVYNLLNLQYADDEEVFVSNWNVKPTTLLASAATHLSAAPPMTLLGTLALYF